ncbi:hypothetical protein N658DRAFT_493082 [Parathielavia hyrcaniae]|uniref:Secreted protein n=1 Tax=Parathielavia hyrcaniae TaxID=113614 RepID=A0AAN6T5H0_9PEZI|nr:hypothetical protein N658DRAFT_493082 [Parathielavia hyrcaniae]
MPHLPLTLNSLIARALPASLLLLLILRLAELSSTCSALVPRLRIARLLHSISCRNKAKFDNFICIAHTIQLLYI